MTTYRGSIEFLLLDVDGVLTDGSVIVDGQSEIVKAFNVRDGLAIALLRAHGIRTGVLSGKSSAPLDYRIRQLGIDFAVTGKLHKREGLAEILRQAAVEPAAVAYVGDDVVDLPLAGTVGAFYAVEDAHHLVRSAADHVLAAPGGRGAAREAAEHILITGGLTLKEAYAPLMDSWERHGAQQ